MAKKPTFIMIPVYMSPEERLIIQKEATKADRSMSRYLKLRGLGKI